MMLIGVAAGCSVLEREAFTGAAFAGEAFDGEAFEFGALDWGAFEEPPFEAAGVSLPLTFNCFGAAFFDTFATVFLAAGAFFLAAGAFFTGLLTLGAFFFPGALLFEWDWVFLTAGLDGLGEAFFFDLGIPEQVMKTIVPAARNVATVKGAGAKAAQYQGVVFAGQGFLFTVPIVLKMWDLTIVRPF